MKGVGFTVAQHLMFF